MCTRSGEFAPEILHRISLFSEVSEATLAQITAHALRRTYSPDEPILWAADPAEAAYFVLEGEVRVYRVSPEGREQVLVRLREGQAFNIVPAFEPNARNLANVAAVTQATCVILLHNDFLHLVLTCCDLAMAVLRDFAGRLAHLTDLVEGLALHTVQERLARFLLDQADADASGTVQRWTQQEIAVSLGTVRDVVGRELRALENAGIIRIERGRILLRDRRTLSGIAAQAGASTSAKIRL